MGITGIWQWILILAIVLILFARPGKISGIMGDFGKGLRNFKSGMKDNDDDEIEAIDSETERSASVRDKTPAKKSSRKKKKKSRA
jgi:sec-independent protein translocase protein TatA